VLYAKVEIGFYWATHKNTCSQVGHINVKRGTKKYKINL
jgi:hypothetical protein